MTLHLSIPGVPAPGGSKTATVIQHNGNIVMANGRPLVTMRDAGKRNKEWRASVAFFARHQYQGEPLHGALRVTMAFVMPRPKAHYRTGRHAGELKPDAPTHHTSKPDALKLARSTEDALTGIVWADDSQTAELRVTKRYGASPGVEVMVETINSGAGQ